VIVQDIWGDFTRHSHDISRIFDFLLAAMTPEEREKFKEEYYHHCCRKEPDKEK
jgi:hypothetical protein